MEQVARKKGMPTLMPDRIGLAEDKRHDWVVDAPVGITVQDIQDPSYWSLIAATMEPMDHIEVRAEDGKWIAYLIVIMCERNYAKVHLDRVIEIKENAEVPLSSIKHRVEYKGAHLKWAVIRASDDQVLNQGNKTRVDAETWLRNFERAQ